MCALRVVFWPNFLSQSGSLHGYLEQSPEKKTFFGGFPGGNRHIFGLKQAFRARNFLKAFRTWSRSVPEGWIFDRCSFRIGGQLYLWNRRMLWGRTHGTHQIYRTYILVCSSSIISSSIGRHEYEHYQHHHPMSVLGSFTVIKHKTCQQYACKNPEIYIDWLIDPAAVSSAALSARASALSASPSYSPSCPTHPARPTPRPPQGCTWAVLHWSVAAVLSAALSAQASALSASPSPSPSCPTRPAHPSTCPPQGSTWAVLVRIISIFILFTLLPTSSPPCPPPTYLNSCFLPTSSTTSSFCQTVFNTPSLTFITWWTSFTLSFLRLIHHNVKVFANMGHSLL